MNTQHCNAAVAICVEVASPEIIDRALDLGWMPNLQRLRDEGAWGTLESITELSSGSIWPTFFTGVNPATHGQFFTHMQLDPGSYRIVKKFADDVAAEPFWMPLHRAGKCCAVIDVPQTRPTKGLNGVHVVGWGGEYPAWRRSSSPPRLMRDLLRRFGAHPLADQYRLALKPESEADYLRLADDLAHGVRGKAGITRWLFEHARFDLFLSVFAEPHWATHLLWHTLDETHPAHGDGLAPRFAGVFQDLFGTIDETIGALRAQRPEADFLVFSLSGMGANYSGWHVLPEVLDRIGMAAPRRARDGSASLAPLKRWGAWVTRAMEDLVSVRAIEAGKRVLPDRAWSAATRRVLFAGSGWGRSRAFWVPNDYSGAIRVNLAGREPAGLVRPGREYESVCDEITEALLELTDIDTARPIVRQVVRPQALHGGRLVDNLPDLLVLWRNESQVNGVTSPRVGTLRCTYPERRSGAHRRTGFLVAGGPRIGRGTTVRNAHILDLAPTLMHLAGVSPPRDYDGRALTEMLES